ncbi:MAG: hypothetical protein LC793_04495 [Thermomicrobia bacterium]|nr:hypothetical protein [Thermomicrobia bacterium]MCA1724651.1 hypothetical protein [Thermomicrobia bacterium]
MAHLFDTLVDRAANLITRGDYRRMHEALPGVEAQLAIEDAGWARWNSPIGRDANDLPDEARSELVRRSRKYFIYDPLCRQAIRLFVSYCIGRGLSIQAESNEAPEVSGPTAMSPLGPVSDPPDPPDLVGLQDDANEFWEHPDNAVVFSVLGQHKSAEKINIDGELFFVAFPGASPTDVTRVRTLMDCLEVTKVITNPDDYSEPWYYLRQWTDIVGGRQSLLYPDIALYGNDLPAITPEMHQAYHLPDEVKIATCNDGADNPYILHRPLNTVGLRGYPLLTPAMDWAKIQRKFLEDRATISAAHARFAWKRTINGPASQLANLPQGANQGSATGPFMPGQVYPGQAYAAGATLSVNGGANWEPVNAQGGGQNAYIESRNFTLQFCRAVGIPEHYFADGSMGTRATSKSMERPVELLFTDFQTVFKSIYVTLFAFALAVKGRPFNAHSVRVDAPKILESDTATIVAALVELLGVLPEFDIEEMRVLMLNAFSMDNPQDLIPKIAAKRQELDDRQWELAKLMAGGDPMAPADPNDPVATAQQLTAIQQFVKNTSRAGQFGPGEPGSPLAVRKVSPSKTKVADDPTRLK